MPGALRLPRGRHGRRCRRDAADGAHSELVSREEQERLLDLRTLLAARENLDLRIGQRGEDVAESDAVSEREKVVLGIVGSDRFECCATCEGELERAPGQTERPNVETEQEATRRGVRQQLRNRPLEADMTTIEDGRRLREPPDLVESLCHPDDSRPVGGLGRHELPDPPCALGVEVVRRLVDQQDDGGHQQRPSDRKPLLHPVGVFADALSGGPFETDVREHGERALHSLPTPHPVQAREEDEVLETRDPEVERAVPRRREPDALPEGPAPGPGFETGDLYGSFGRSQQPREDPDQRRLSGAVRPEQRVDLALVDRNGDVVQHGLGEPVRDAGRVEGGTGSGREARLGRGRWPSRDGRPVTVEAGHHHCARNAWAVASCLAQLNSRASKSSRCRRSANSS